MKEGAISDGTAGKGVGGCIEATAKRSKSRQRMEQHLRSEISMEAYDGLVAQYEVTRRLDVSGEAFAGLTEAGCHIAWAFGCLGVACMPRAWRGVGRRVAGSGEWRRGEAHSVSRVKCELPGRSSAGPRLLWFGIACDCRIEKVCSE